MVSSVDAVLGVVEVQVADLERHASRRGRGRRRTARGGGRRATFSKCSASAAHSGVSMMRSGRAGLGHRVGSWGRWTGTDRISERATRGRRSRAVDDGRPPRRRIGGRHRDGEGGAELVTGLDPAVVTADQGVDRGGHRLEGHEGRPRGAYDLGVAVAVADVDADRALDAGGVRPDEEEGPVDRAVAQAVRVVERVLQARHRAAPYSAATRRWFARRAASGRRARARSRAGSSTVRSARATPGSGTYGVPPERDGHRDRARGGARSW